MKSQRSSHSLNSQEGRVQLPRITNNNYNETRGSTEGDYFENPFYVPADEEIFKLKAKEKELKELEKERNRELKIWQKGIKHSSEGKLRKIMELTNLEDEENQDEQDGKLNIVDAAKSAIKNRVRHREPLLNFLNKKREMFLFQMSINEKKEQIKEFEELAHLQEISLQNSKELLEKDAETFKQYVEKNKNETRQAIKNAEEETKEKQKKIQGTKQLQEELSTVMSKNTKQLEKLNNLFAYKEFLDELTPDEFLNEQLRLKEERNNGKDSANFFRIDSKEANADDWLIYNLSLSPGLLKFLNDSDDNFEMYFKEEHQLQELFDNLEEKNLFIIKNTQDIEQTIENLKKSLEQKEAEITQREQQLEKNRQDLKKGLQDRIKVSNLLNGVSRDNSTERTLSIIESKINEVFNKSEFLKEGKSDHKMSGQDILRLVESKLDQQLKDLNKVSSQFVAKKYSEHNKARQEEINKEKLRDVAEAKRSKAEEKRQKRIHKRIGRPIMNKSMPPKKKEEKNDEDEKEKEKDYLAYKLDV